MIPCRSHRSKMGLKMPGPGKITHDTLRKLDIDPEKTGLARFIPVDGVDAAAFIGLPLEEHLARAKNISSHHWISIKILFSEGILSDEILHRIMIFTASEVLMIFEDKYGADERPLNAIETKKRWLEGAATDQEIDQAKEDANWAVEETLSGEQDEIRWLPTSAQVYAAIAARQAASREKPAESALSCVDAAWDAARTVSLDINRDDDLLWEDLHAIVYDRLCELIARHEEKTNYPKPQGAYPPTF